MAPRKKPTPAGIQLYPGYILSEISMAGLRRLQNEAATITPPVNPSMGSNTPRLMVLKKNTQAAPAAVTSQVNTVARKAAHTGSIERKKD